MDFPSDISPQCQNDDRVECGYYGIDQAGCELRGCCWSPTTAAGQPWCYQVKGKIPWKNYLYYSVVQKSLRQDNYMRATPSLFMYINYQHFSPVKCVKNMIRL